VSPRPIPARHVRAHLTDKMTFRESWIWPRDVKRWFVRETSDLEDPCPRPIVHLACGSSKLGEIRVDKYHPGANVRASFFALPFAEGSIGTVILDPPYDIQTNQRILLHKEVARVLRTGGRLLWCAPWIPDNGNFSIERIVVASLRTGLPRNARILIRASRRVPGPKVGQGQKKAAAKVLAPEVRGQMVLA
jgi:hypothetical protein